MRRNGRAFACAAVAFGVVGCRSIIGIEHLAGGDDPSDTGGAPDVTGGDAAADVSGDVNGADIVFADRTDAGGLTCGSTAAPPAAPSCSAGAPGAGMNCAPTGATDCCQSLLVPCGEFNRSNEDGSHANVDNFYLDKFEVTVGRFRAFFDAYPTSKPSPGAGALPHYGPSSGWRSEWDVDLPVDQAALLGTLHCNAMFQTWTDAPFDAAPNSEHLPINCVNWFTAFAFCAWDRGRLPTEAEWNYAAAGGKEQRTYPWGSDAPEPHLAVYGCFNSGDAGCELADIAVVGSHPRGNGRFEQSDLAGNVFEWNLDWYVTPYAMRPNCDNCADLTSASSMRAERGGSYRVNAIELLTSTRRAGDPRSQAANVGFRCARDPAR